MIASAANTLTRVELIWLQRSRELTRVCSFELSH